MNKRLLVFWTFIFSSLFFSLPCGNMIAHSEEFPIADSGLNPCVAGLSSGNFVVVYESYGQDLPFSDWDIYGQLIDNAGGKIGGEFLINTYTTGSQRGPCVAALADGGFVVVWTSYGQDGEGEGVFGQRYNYLGQKVGGEFQINTYTQSDQYGPKAAGLSNGGFVVVWNSWPSQDLSGSGVYGQVYDASGIKVGIEFRVNTYTSYDQVTRSVAGLLGGGFVVVWHSYLQDGDGFGVIGNYFDNSGNMDGREGIVNEITAGSQQNATVAPLSDGGVVATWLSGQDEYWPYAQIVNKDLFLVGSNIMVTDTPIGLNNPYLNNPFAVGLADGGFMIIWDVTPATPTFLTREIYAQRFDTVGNRVGDKLFITSNDGLNPFAAARASNKVLIAWEGYYELNGLTYGKMGIFGTIIETGVFSDIPINHWAYNYVMAIYDAGITTGYGGGRFGPEDTVTREQMAVFLTRALNEVPADGYCGSEAPFLDVGSDRWSCKYVKRLVELGITAGVGQGLFGPEDAVTREQMAVFLTRALNQVPADGYCGATSPFTDVPYDWWSCKYVKKLLDLGLSTGYGDGRFGPEEYVTRAQMAVFLSRAFLKM